MVVGEATQMEKTYKPKFMLCLHRIAVKPKITGLVIVHKHSCQTLSWISITLNNQHLVVYNLEKASKHFHITIAFIVDSHLRIFELPPMIQHGTIRMLTITDIKKFPCQQLKELLGDTPLIHTSLSLKNDLLRWIRTCQTKTSSHT